MRLSEKNWVSSGCYSQSGVGEAGQVSLGAAWGLLDGQLLSLSEPQGDLGWTISGAPLCPVLCNLRMALGMPVTRSASCLHAHSPQPLQWLSPFSPCLSSVPLPGV